MLKKAVAILLALVLPAVSLSAMAEDVIINKIAHPENTFAFEEGAPLLEVYFPAVFGVDAAYVRYGDYSIIIDCGGNEWRIFDDMLNKLGVTEVTYAVNSHPDADHIGGFNQVFKHISCGEFLLGFPEDYEHGDDLRFKVYKDLHAMNIPFRRVGNGDTIEFGDVQITVYQRLEEHLPRVNNRSVMLMIQLGERRVFFTGDIQYDAQALLVADADKLDLHADILKYPHHGYRNMMEGFLKMVDPKLVVITGGTKSVKGNEILDQFGIKYYYTFGGNLRFATDGTVWTAERFK